MYDQSLHFREGLNGKYPEPDIAADEAWADMRVLLDGGAAEGTPGDVPGTGVAPGMPGVLKGVPSAGGLSWMSMYLRVACVLLGATGILFLLWRSWHNAVPVRVSVDQVKDRPIGPRDSGTGKPGLERAGAGAAGAAHTGGGENRVAEPGAGKTGGEENRMMKPGDGKTGTVEKIGLAGTRAQAAGAEAKGQGKTVATGSVTGKIKERGTGKARERKREIEMSRAGESGAMTDDVAKNDETKRVPGRIGIVESRGFSDPAQVAAFQPPRGGAGGQLQNDESRAKAAGKPGKAAGRPASLHFGLQWNVQAPLPDGSHYFTGTGGSSQPYLLVIPDLWVSRSFGSRQEVRLQFRPYQQYFTGNRSEASDQGPLSVNDSTPVTRTTRLIKTSGIAIGLHYDLHFNGSWSAGAGISYGWQSRALIDKRTIRSADNQVLSDSLFGVRKTSGDWPDLRPVIFGGELELSYRVRRVQLGASLFIPLRSVSEASGAGERPVNGRVFLRWGLR